MNQRIGNLESVWTRVDGLTIHARASAKPVYSTKTPVIILIHGLVVSSRYMIPTAERLAPYRYVFAPDLPGFGKSSKPTRVFTIPELADVLVAWMKNIGLERAVFLGNSVGCQVLVDLAVRYPTRVERAVLTGPTMDLNARSAIEQVKRLLIDWTRERPSLALPILIDFYESGLFRAVQTFRYALEDPIEEKLPHVQAPTLVVRGSRDPIVPQRWAEMVAGLLPRGRLVVIPGAPHCVNYSTSTELTRVILSFLCDRREKET